MARKKTKEERLARVITDNKVECVCGHMVFVPQYAKRVLCTWCNRFVYKDKKEEFKDKIQSELRRNK